jgi:hypothetical protein
MILPIPGNLPEGEKNEHFRLLNASNKPVNAQFVRLDAKRVALDFTVGIGPDEKQRFKVEYGPKVPPPPAPKGGISVKTTEDEYLVSQGGLTYTVPKKLLGFLHSAKTGKTDYLQSGSPGLMLINKDNATIRVGDKGPDGVSTKSNITRQGPLCASIRFESTESLRGNRSVPSVVEMTFPSSKSWVRVDWTIDDPNGFVAAMGSELKMNVPEGPVLVDFGAGSYTYTTLKQTQATRLVGSWRKNLTDDAILEARGVYPEWHIDTGETGQLTRFARGKADAPIEGWAHVMDKQHCTALAIADFVNGKRHIGAGEIFVNGEGKFEWRQNFFREGNPPTMGKKSLTFWLHFVPMPVQIGALTSPQSMMHPLKVTLIRGK